MVAYTECIIGSYTYRIFEPNSDPYLFKWHYDENDREVHIISSGGWKFQEDNHLPIELGSNTYIKINKGIYHRVIQGNSPLVIRFTESQFR
jgi:hypothetical protein